MEEFVSDLVKKAPRVRKKKAEGADSGGKADAAASEPDEWDSEKDRTLAKATIQTVMKQLYKPFNHARNASLCRTIQQRFESAIQPGVGET
jgi:hypothetical protein